LRGAAAGAAGAAVAGLAPSGIATATPRPTGSAYVRYEDLYRPGMTLQQVIQKVPSGKILTFPEGEFTFRNFASPVGWYDGIRITPNCRGLVGSGRNTVFKMVPYTSTKASAVPAQSKGGNNPTKLMRIANVNGVVLMNFSLIGTPQGHLYSGLCVTQCSNVLVDGLYLRGASPGDWNYPPGETFGLLLWEVTGATVRNTEIDGRDTAGNRICASPLGGVECRDITVQNVYAHHSRTGAVTFYEVVNLATTDLRAEYNGTGSGGKNAAGINHENVTGRIRHHRPRLIIDRAHGNTGLHVHLQNGKQDVTDIQITDIVHDAGPGAHGCFSVMIGDGYRDPERRTQKQRTLPRVTKNGVTLTPLDANLGTRNANANRNFVRYH
jgi:hypothetical protein